MVRLNFDSFVHRANRDGTTESICKSCFVTVCTSTWETDLARAEREHVCDPGVVAKWKKIQDRNLPKSN
jgi:hypothetical protein